ncbi:MAG: hypothetical protein JHC33_05095 [Ignisphaera sp.]|nr:hypothetical protein [Ignisphaera sp.]
MNKLTFGDFYTIVWSLVPAVWKNADDEYGKSLQLLLYTMSQHMYYYFYNRIVHMEELFDPDRCPDKYLRFLAGMLGWTLIGKDPASWREQIKAAPLLYKFRGTKRGLLLAEKLVGYSVFMSELYRDHVGDIVPKERIFNNTPASITMKPWFRNVLTSLEGELLPGTAESDQFDSFNITNLVKLDAHGSVIRPRILTNTRKLVFTPSSTTARYENLSGKYSRARYAKMPRINLVLKYEHDLDTENPDGSIKENNFKGALDLLMQFKPFHVLIENLEVRYDLSEFIFDQTTISSDIFNVQEEVDAAVLIDMPRAENTITYSTTPAVEVTTVEDIVPASPLDNRGVITSVHKTIDLSLLPYTKETSLFATQMKSLPIKAFEVSNKVDSTVIGVVDNTLVTLDDYPVQTPDPGAPEMDTPLTGQSGVYTTTDLFGNIIDEVYNPGHTILKYDINSILTEPILDFKAMLSSQHAKTTVSFNQTTKEDSNGFNKVMLGYYTSNLAEPIGMKPEIYQVGLNTGNTLTNTNADWPLTHPITDAIVWPGTYRSYIGTKIDSSVDGQLLITPTTLNPTPLSRPWDLQEMNSYKSMYLSDPLLKIPLLVDTLKTVYDNTIMVVINVQNITGSYLILIPGVDYYFDNNQNIFLNSASIGVKATVPETTYNFLLTKTLHILYLSRITYKNESDLGIPIRGFRTVNRTTKKYTRQFLINTIQTPTLANVMPTTIVSIDGKTKQKTILGTKQFKSSTNIYNRSSLKNEVIEDYNVVSRYALNRIDKSKWTVYAPEYTPYYSGDQKITNNWWGNYYEAKSTNPQIPYDKIDLSEAGQTEHVSSDQWMTALQTYNVADPKHFLVTRKTDTVRTSIWNRSSCKFASVPYIQGSRNNLQVFRKDVTNFNRSEASTDYTTDTNTPPRLDNYKYILPDGTDVSMSYFSPGFSEVERTLVTMDRGLGSKATLSTTGYNLNFPSSDMYYDNYASGLDAETYFSGTSPKYRVKTSLYAGNIPVNLDPATTPGINESLDKLNILVTGLIPVTDTFTVTADETIFTLSEINLYVTWISENTGETVAFGYYSPASTNGTLSPNIQVTLNGLLIPFKTSWSIGFDRIKMITILDQLYPGDIITISYETFPLAPDVAPPLPQVPHTIANTLTSTDIYGQHTFDGNGNPLINIQGIRDGNRYIVDLPTDTFIPSVSWYDKTTLIYINSSSNPRAYQPLAFYEDAVPNINISLNGFLLNYKKDWTFLIKFDSGVYSAAIAFSTNLSLALFTGDQILIDYFSTT